MNRVILAKFLIRTRSRIVLLALRLAGDVQCFVAPRADFTCSKKNQIRTLAFRAGARRLDGFQVLDQVVLLLLCQAEFEDTIVMVDDRVEARLAGNHFDM